jgi:ABC-type transport system substrate-binding protein
MNGFIKQAVIFMPAVCFIILLVSGCSEREGQTNSDEMVLRYSLISKVTNLDPGNIQDVYGAQVISQVCESLYTYHYLQRPFEIIPCLAADMPIISDDKLTYTIPIKKGILFHDNRCFPSGKGRELKANDFVFAFKRIANIKYASVNWGGLKDYIVGLNEFREYTKGFKTEYDVDYSYDVEGLQTIDDYTLQIKLTKPWPQLINDLTNVVTAPVAKEVVDYYRIDAPMHPIGTGPFKLTTWQRGVYIELERNENYRKDYYPTEGELSDLENGFLRDAGKQIPFVDRVVYRVIEEYQPAWLLFLRGEFDRLYIPKENFDSAVDIATKAPKQFMKDRHIEVTIKDQPSLYYLGINMKDPILGNNLPLRKALSFALNRDQINELMYNNRWRVVHSLIHPSLDGYNPEVAELNFTAFDLEKAKEFLKQAEKIHGGPIPPLKIGWPGSDPFSRQYAQLVQRQMEKAGIKIEINFLDWPTYLDMMNKGQHQLFGSGVRFSSPDPLGVFGMFPTKYFAPLSNSFFYSNPEYDALYDQVEVMFPGPERTKLFHEMEKMVLSDYPAVFTTQRVQYNLHHEWYDNYKPHPFLYAYVKYIRIDPEQQKAYKGLLKELKKKD